MPERRRAHYRLRRPVDQGRGFASVVATSRDGRYVDTVATVTSDEFDCASLERPALVRRPDGGWLGADAWASGAKAPVPS